VFGLFVYEVLTRGDRVPEFLEGAQGQASTALRGEGEGEGEGKGDQTGQVRIKASTWIGLGVVAPANEACRGWRTCILGLWRLGRVGLGEGRIGFWARIRACEGRGVVAVLCRVVSCHVGV
jgi:hypothetical protein